MTTLNNKNNRIQLGNFSKKMTEAEYEDILNKSRKTRGYSLEQAKKYLNLL